MSRKQTVDLLNEVWDFDRRMRWMLFVQENESVVYGDGTGWQPGEGLFEHPAFLYRDEGNHPRPLFELIDVDTFSTLWVAPGVLNPRHPCCKTCEVTWERYEDPCWMCGFMIDEPMHLEYMLWNFGPRQPLPTFRIYQNNLITHSTADQIRVMLGMVTRSVPPLVSAFRAFETAMGEAGAVMLERWGDVTPDVDYVEYSASDVAYSRVLHDMYVRNLEEPFVIEVEPYNFPPEDENIYWYGVNDPDRDYTSRSSRLESMRGYRSQGIWIDEWTSSPLPKDVSVKTTSGITLVIPRQWRQVKKIESSKKRYTTLIEMIVAEHKRLHPGFYRTSEPAYYIRNKS